MSCILAIDDRPINRQFLVSLLGYGGHTVLEAEDGEDAFPIVRHSHPDLIITDIKMPRMDGYEFVELLRKDATIAGTPVIFYTASFNEREARGLAQSLGVIEVITKPSRPDVILERVNAALGIGQKAENVEVVSNTHAQRELAALQDTGLKLSALVELGLELSSERDPRRRSLRRFSSTG